MRSCEVHTASRVEAQTQGGGSNPEGCLEEAQSQSGLQLIIWEQGNLLGRGCWSLPVMPVLPVHPPPPPEPVSQLQTGLTLLDRGASPRLEMSCQATSGSPPITYSLVGKDGHVHLQQTPPYGQPANFSVPLTQTPAWLQCQAQNGVGVQSSPLTLVPPGERAPGSQRAAGTAG